MPRTIRRHRKQFDTAIWHYSHPTGSLLTLIGIVHVGDSAYYGRIAQFIASRIGQGATVHYERITKPTPEQQAALTRTDQRLIRLRVHGEGTTRSLMAGPQGLEHQSQVLPYDHPRWVNHDMSALTLAQRLGRTQLLKLARQSRQSEALQANSPEATSRAVNFFLQHPLIIRIASALQRYGHVSRVIIDQRNAIAVQAVAVDMAVGPKANLVLLWGAAHLPGIHAGLETLGFRRFHRDWVARI